MNKTMPVGIQDFKKLRTDPKNFLYIDKTREIYNLLNFVSVGFLSRPRRFGKSLLVSTIQYLFEGEKDLFEGLWIYDKWDWDQTYPVILLDFGKFTFESLDELKALIEEELVRIGRSFGVEVEGVNYASKFAHLIEGVARENGKQVVVLVDEYDRPILDHIEDLEFAKRIREALKGFYTILKSMDRYVKFLLLTGVTRFSRAGIFSGLNNLKDISLDPRFGNIVGITQAELEEYLAPYIDECGGNMEEVKEWYNGYNFLGDSLYNPFDILKYVDNGCDIQNYWFESGTPTFLIKVIEMGNFYLPQLDNVIVGKEMMDRFDVENIRPEVVLFQAGYLTIDEVLREDGFVRYKLRIPNREVRQSLNTYFLEELTDKRVGIEQVAGLSRALREGDVEKIKRLIEGLFESIPYHYHTKNEIAKHEGYYASVLFAFFSGTGLMVQGEDVSRVGRADITVFAKDKIYIIEIKTDADEPAIKQIEERGYYEKYRGKGKIYLVGINISSAERRPKEIRIVTWGE